jgi:hypothetical protein
MGSPQQRPARHGDCDQLILCGTLFGRLVGACVADALFRVVVLWETGLGQSLVGIKL